MTFLIYPAWFLGGSIFGVILMALMAAAGNADRCEECRRNPKWILCSDRLPTKNGSYLTIKHYDAPKHCLYEVLDYAHDLYKVDDFDFYAYKGESGWYGYDSEYGYFKTDVDAWMPLPESYQKERNDE